MISLVEIAERSQKGPKVIEKDWDLGHYRRISELVAKYEIKIPPDLRDSWFNMDDGLVSRAFEAAVDLLATAGVYCITTNRVVEFSRREILQAIAEAPNYVLMGEGRDRRTFSQKRIEGREPLNFCPGHHTPFTEDIAPLVVKNFAQIPRTDFIEGFNLTHVDGREIFGVPLEVYATRRELGWMREGVRKAGRPGAAIVYYPINTRAACLISAMDPIAGLRPTDGILLSLLPDLKMEHDLLSAAIVCEEYGCFRLSGSFAIAGGFCGGVDGAIVEGIAKPLAAMLCYRDYISYTGVEHLQQLSGRRMMLQPLGWARSLVDQALNSKTNTICMAWVIPTSGPGTAINLLESAVRCIEAQINGANLYAPRQSRTTVNHGQTPLEAEWMLEIADAVARAGYDRRRAGDLLWRIADKLAGQPVEPGQSIQECYDLVNHRPSPEYERIYTTVKADLAEMGLPLS